MLVAHPSAVAKLLKRTEICIHFRFLQLKYIHPIQSKPAKTLLHPTIQSQRARESLFLKPLITIISCPRITIGTILIILHCILFLANLKLSHNCRDRHLSFESCSVYQTCAKSTEI